MSNEHGDELKSDGVHDAHTITSGDTSSLHDSDTIQAGPNRQDIEATIAHTWGESLGSDVDINMTIKRDGGFTGSIGDVHVPDVALRGCRADVVSQFDNFWRVHKLNR